MIEFVFLGLGSLLSIYGALYLLLGLAQPGMFIDLLAVNEADRKAKAAGSGKGWLSYLRIGATLIGLGILFYYAGGALVMMLPADWGSLNEDGEWEYTRHGLQFTFATIASLTVVSSLEDRAEEAIKWRVLSREAKVLGDEFRHHADAEAAKRVLFQTEREFEDKFAGRSEYERALREEAARDLRQMSESRIARSND